MNSKGIIVALLALLTGGVIHAQTLETVVLNSTVHNTTTPAAAYGTRILAKEPTAAGYELGVDYWITLTGSCTAPNAFSLLIEEVNLRRKSNGTACADTVFIYDGVGITAPLLWYATGNEMSPVASTIYASPSNVAQALTIRFKSCTDCGSWNPSTGTGFSLVAGCKYPCEGITPHLDSIFYKTRNGEIYEFGRIKTLYDSIKVYDATVNDSVWQYIPFEGVNLCYGDGVIFTAHCDYTSATGWYTPSDATSTFRWDFGTGDTMVGTGLTSVYYDEYLNLQCYEASLSVTDERGCGSTIFPQVRVRLAQTPLKTLFTLDEICNNESLYVNMGYNGESATLILQYIEYQDMKSQTYDVQTFIPDGADCGSSCYEAPVTFSDFPSGKKVESADDICSICINYEHSFMGDYDLAILCPDYGLAGTPANHGRAVLKYYQNASVPIPPGTSYGSSTYTGIPYGGNADYDYDLMGGNKCDYLQNPYGIGWTYCFSRNEDYTLVNGQPASTSMPANAGPASGNNTVNVTVTMPPIPAGYYSAGSTCGTVTVTTLDSSNHEEKTGYYIPADNFSTLVGCPLNGEWRIQLCDYWGQDNGWVFSWSLDICNVSNGGCEYQVPIDSIVWQPDSTPVTAPGGGYCDYELGHYRGAEVRKKSPLESYISSPDTAGTFKINVTIYDAFGCVWDTSTMFTTYWAPKPNLGQDIKLCGVQQVTLDASDAHSADHGYTYLWEPYGQTEPVITTEADPSGDVQYIVEARNITKHDGKETKCYTRDTINVLLRRQPIPSFNPTPFTLEGCDPMTISFDNQSLDADYHYWDFGDGITSVLSNPVHTYTEGVYDLKYFATSSDGCTDSVVLHDAVTVFPAPKASFSWSPVYPAATNPIINLHNETVPLDGNQYFWELQYNRDNPLSVETLTDVDPTYNFSQYVDPKDLPGSYVVRLIARSDNIAPSGNVLYCSDTVENTILIVNDYLQFPNVVTPNGDGINDVFRIVGLVDGLGYPINQLDIYNKWGSLVFHRENIASEEDFWDPADMPSGTYFYRFTAKGYNGNIEHSGAIEVLK